jgi:hypothetical protein
MALAEFDDYTCMYLIYGPEEKRLHVPDLENSEKMRCFPGIKQFKFSLWKLVI